jgi:hypothetical protein
MWGTLAGIFLILHGLAHVGLAVAPRPDDPQKKIWGFFTRESRLLTRFGAGPRVVSRLGLFLAGLAALLFVLAGGGLIAGLPAWSVATAAGAVVSLALLSLYWHAYLPIGVLIDLAVLAYVVLVK